jgi:hypothetical protein
MAARPGGHENKVIMGYPFVPSERGQERPFLNL